MATANTAAPKPVLPPLLMAEEFLEIEISAKEPLIEGLLCRRDIVALAGRRRHGKTSFITNLATVLAQGRDEFLGYSIPSARRVLVYYFEDDSREIQDKLRNQPVAPGNSFHIQQHIAKASPRPRRFQFVPSPKSLVLARDA